MLKMLAGLLALPLPLSRAVGLQHDRRRRQGRQGRRRRGREGRREDEELLMEPFRLHTGLVAPLDRANVDTDSIIPKQFLKSIKRSGFGPNLFDAWRYLDRGEPGMSSEHRPRNPDFVLNEPRYQGASILLARRNFGCGSSREHAPWALADYGFRALIAPSYADIFYNNCCKNGLLPIVLAESEVDRLFDAVKAFPGFRLVIDLERQTVATPDGAHGVRLRHRYLPQASPRQRPRRHRPHAAARGRDPRVRGEASRRSRGSRGSAYARARWRARPVDEDRDSSRRRHRPRDRRPRPCACSTCCGARGLAIETRHGADRRRGLRRREAAAARGDPRARAQRRRRAAGRRRRAEVRRAAACVAAGAGHSRHPEGARPLREPASGASLPRARGGLDAQGRGGRRARPHDHPRAHRRHLFRRAARAPQERRGRGRRLRHDALQRRAKYAGSRASGSRPRARAARGCARSTRRTCSTPASCGARS